MHNFPPTETNWWWLLPVATIVITLSIAFRRAGWPAIWEFLFAIGAGIFSLGFVLIVVTSGAITNGFIAFMLVIVIVVSTVFLHMHAVRREPRYSKGVISGAIGGWLSVFSVLLVQVGSDVGSARETTKRTTCKSHIFQIASGFHHYHAAHNHFPAAIEGNPPMSWRVQLDEWLWQTGLAQQYDSKLSWDDGPNRGVQKQKLPYYACPSRPHSFDADGRFLTSYLLPTGAGAAFDGPKGIPISAIKDGTSNTLIVVEACGSNVVWTEPRDQPVAAAAMSVNGPGQRPGESDSLISSYHTAGAQVALADGSVHFISESTDARVLRALLSIDGGEEIPDW